MRAGAVGMDAAREGKLARSGEVLRRHAPGVEIARPVHRLNVRAGVELVQLPGRLRACHLPKHRAVVRRFPAVAARVPEPIRWLEKPRIDLRWEVSAAPTDEMWEAMRRTRIGTADFGEDTAVRELEAVGAELAGHEAALLVPTVTVGTVLSLLAGAARG